MAIAMALVQTACCWVYGCIRRADSEARRRTFKCPQCRALIVPSEKAKRCRCPQCKAVLQVPAPADSTPQLSPALAPAQAAPTVH